MLEGVDANTDIPSRGTGLEGDGDEAQRCPQGEAWCVLGEGARAPHTPNTPPTLAFPDVDECLEQMDECHPNQICENTPGGHRCSCPRGYRIQGPGLPCLGMGRVTPSLGPWSAPPAHRQDVITKGAMSCDENCSQPSSCAHHGSGSVLCPLFCTKTSHLAPQGHLPWEPRRRRRVERNGWVLERLCRQDGPHRETEGRAQRDRGVWGAALGEVGASAQSRLEWERRLGAGQDEGLAAGP